MSEKRKKGRPANGDKLQLSGEHIRQYLSATGRNRSDLAGLLNVTAATMSRWADKSEKRPKRTEFLVLIPLLLSQGVNMLPDPDDAAIDAFLASYREFLAPNVQSDPKLRRALKRKFAIRSNPEVKAARRLYEELATAWRVIEEEIGMKPGDRWPV